MMIMNFRVCIGTCIVRIILSTPNSVTPNFSSRFTYLH